MEHVDRDSTVLYSTSLHNIAPFIWKKHEAVKASSTATLIKKKALPTLVIANILFICGLVLLELMAPIVMSTTRMRVLRIVMKTLITTAMTDRVTESSKIIPSELTIPHRKRRM